MNPIEDEAVVAELLRLGKGTLRLVDAHPVVSQLKGLPGVAKWKVFDRDMKQYSSTEDVTDQKLKKIMCQSCFPPTEEEAKEMHLDYTFVRYFLVQFSFKECESCLIIRIPAASTWL